jgi:hypothetical protein
MDLTKLEKQSLRVALEYAICDYETQLESLIDNDYPLEDITEQRQLVKGMQRVQTKLTNQLEKVS